MQLRFPPAPDQVRIARLVAAAVARRAHFDEARLDDLRLAVGEACARAVRRCQASGCVAVVVMIVDDAGPDLRVDVMDAAEIPESDEPVVLNLLRGLADEVRVDAGDGGAGSRIEMEWRSATRRIDLA